MFQLDDTIVAIASPAGGGGEGIVRISGGAAFACLATCILDPEPWSVSSPHVLNTCGGFQAHGISSPIPCRCYGWPDRRSYTGQPSVELHAIGSMPLLNAIVRSLCMAGARLAEPGEFTLRAFLSGRVDLTQAEAVLGVIDAASPTALHAALGQLAGGLTEPLRKSRSQLLDLLADLEAGLDFSDEDIRFIAPGEIRARLAEIRSRIESLARQLSARNEIGPLMRIVLVGRPNVGKSSLFNRLAGRRGAIVSPTAGTTRDYLAAEVEFDGVACLLIDTAGVLEYSRNASALESIAQNPLGSVEQSQSRQNDRQFQPTLTSQGLSSIDAQAREASRRQNDAAQLRILCLDSTQPMDAQETAEWIGDASNDTIVALTKADLVEARSISALSENPSFPSAVAVSSQTGDGIELLRSAIKKEVAAGSSQADCVPTTAIRCRESVRLALEAIHQAELLARDECSDELVAAEVRMALQELGRVLGAVYTDDVLDRVFSRFCVGK